MDEVIENTTGDSDHTYTQGYAEALGAYMAEAPEQYEGLVRLITAYRREIDEDGIPVCSVTTFSESAEGYAKTYTMSVDSGRYPFGQS